MTQHPHSDDTAGMPDLPDVRMAEGLLHCPHCDSMDLMPETQGVLVCDDCGERCLRFSDQCPQCGSRGVTQVEQIGFSAPGQRPSEAPRKIVKQCDSCGYSNG